MARRTSRVPDQDVTPRPRNPYNPNRRPFDHDRPNPADRDEIFHEPEWREEDTRNGYRRI